MQTIQHATNLPYIPQYTMWNYAMEHPVLFFMIVCFTLLIVDGVIEVILKIFISLFQKLTTIVNNITKEVNENQNC